MTRHTRDPEIDALAAAGHGAPAIAAALGLGQGAVSRALRRLGRRAKPGPRPEGRDARVVVTFSAGEAAEVQGWAEDRGQPVTVAAREVLLAAVRNGQGG
jgi:hypothetical protein